MVSYLLRFRPSLLIAGTARRVVAPYEACQKTAMPFFDNGITGYCAHE